MSPFIEILLLLTAAVLIVGAFQRAHVPSSLGYLLAGALVGPHALGLVQDQASIHVVAEFGLVFLLFTIGLNFSLPQIYALRHTVLGLGTGQVVLTTAAVGAMAWWAGMPAAAAFVVGAVFAQSSTTIIARQLAEQGDEGSRHGRMALAMSVFQDVTAVPFVVVIPVLGVAAAGTAATLGEPLAWALAKAALSFAIVFFAGRLLLRPLFHEVAARRSTELFTLVVLLVALGAAAVTDSLGVSLAFGAFLAGMTLGETEFRHQVEASIRPFRDMLLGLFFVSIGMLLDLRALPAVWHWALMGAAALLLVKGLLVFGLVRWSGVDSGTALKTGITLAVGGEFGFALLALALDAQVMQATTGQAVLSAVLFSMVAGPYLIRHAGDIADRLVRPAAATTTAPQPDASQTGTLRNHVIICGFGRIGQNVARFLEEEGLDFVALDLDPERVREAHTAGEAVYFGDSGDRAVLESVGLAGARLVVVSHGDLAASLRLLGQVRALRDDLPVMVRTRDESGVDDLMRAGATEVVPETLEAGVMMATHALLLLDVPLGRVVRRFRDVRVGRYRLMREFFRSSEQIASDFEDRLHAVTLPDGAEAIGRTLADIDLAEGKVLVTALMRRGRRILSPSPGTSLEAGDVLVLFGAPADLQRVESALLD